MPLLTDVVLRRAKAPATDRTELWDSKVTGLVFRITASAARSWSVFYRYNGEKRRLTLGTYRPEGTAGAGLTLAEARARARAALRDVADGHDPQGEKVKARAEARRSGSTLKDVAEKWLAEGRITKGERKGQPWRPKTRTEFARLVHEEIVPVLGDLGPGAVTKAHIRTLYDNIEKRAPSIAKHTLAVLRLMYQWAAEEDHVDLVPVFPKRGTQSNKRSRVLEEHELRAVWKALDAGLVSSPGPDHVGVLAEGFRLMLLTAQRRQEVLSMRWSDITEEKGAAWWTVPAERAKSGREHRVPLTAPAVAALKRLHTITGSGEYVFPSPKPTAKEPFVTNPQKAAARLWRATGLKGSAHVHDLRRTAATYMTRLGVARLMVGKILDHADTDVTGRYDKYAYDREKRAGLEKWADEVLRIVTDTEVKGEARVLPWAR